MHIFLLFLLFVRISAGHRHSHSRFHSRGSNGDAGNSDSTLGVVRGHEDDSINLAAVPYHPFILPRELTTLSESGQTSDVASSGDYTCGPNKACGNEACCGESGWCGANVQEKVIAYWEAWNENKPCGHMSPQEVPVHDITHLIFSFGFVTPGDFRITNMPDVKSSLLTQVADLKDKNPNLSIMIALGGWTHNDPGKYQTVFSDMVSTRANRQLFIKNLLGFLSQYGFDGVDFDWEYPGAKDRGGKEADGKNFTQFLKELQAAMRSGGRHYLVTYTAPTSYWYLRHFDLKAMNSYVDWINLMSYDLHGIWDRDNPIGNQILGHTNLTEIDMALDLFWRNDIQPEDIVLGIGLYGRSFKLESPSCWKPGCRFSDPGDKGKCTDTAGFLSYREIMDLIKDTKAKPVYDKDAKVNYMVYGDNNWISYDDERTFQDKIDFANKRGLNGVMMWAIDLDDSKHSALSAITGKKNLPPGVVALEMNVETRSEEAGYSSDDSSQCRVTDCGGVCSDGERLVGRTNSLDKKKECGKKPSNARSICCPSWASIYDTECHWDRGKGGLSGDCAGKCNPGELKLFADQRGWSGDLETGGWNGKYCSRGSQVFCCSIGNMEQYMDICTWSKCGGTCPDDKQHVLTVDTGGPAGVNDRCSGAGSGMGYAFDNDAQDPKTGQKGRRKLCCPKKDSFSNCSWRSANVCSRQCDNGQITLDLDPRGMGGSACGSEGLLLRCPRQKESAIPTSQLGQTFPIRPTASARFTSPAGIAFFLLAGSDTSLASMSKRNNPNLVFLDCPKEIHSQPVHQAQTARVICLGVFEECFGVAKDGVEGTVVHMPTDCGSGSYARAVSLVPSQNQSIPVELARHHPSAVYDFSFDYDMGLVRRDSGEYSLRIDYSNVRGYWNAVVDLTGKKRNLKHLVDRFYADNSKDWFTQFDKTDVGKSEDLNDNTRSILNQLLYFDSQMCDVNGGEREGQGFSLTLEGSSNAKFFYGFSLIATWKPGYKVKDKQTKQDFAFIHLVVDELGSRIHHDRLAIFLSNSNRMKGSLFGGSKTTTDATFDKLAAGAEQLLQAREVGLIFGYMGRDEVWGAFCDSYNGILDLMALFDAWYLKKSTNTSDLAAQWVKFIRSELDMVAKQAQDDVKRLYGRKKSASKKYDDFWEVVMKGPTAEMNKVKLDKISTCKKLPAITVLT
ncbi:uncharacterized protein FTOL_13423 [Fusarium torulosum]|uniref:chitinase n=1 Tax=Fusarium torulosum TaxID=33205 RepID=A0AAE8MNS4_9HYPO|nr:uncharacterized protein FTOL_13423 [Fusarium torulosum]